MSSDAARKLALRSNSVSNAEIRTREIGDRTIYFGGASPRIRLPSYRAHDAAVLTRSKREQCHDESYPAWRQTGPLVQLVPHNLTHRPSRNIKYELPGTSGCVVAHEHRVARSARLQQYRPGRTQQAGEMTAHDERFAFAGNLVQVGSRKWSVDYPVRDARLVGDSLVVVYDYTAGPKNRQFRNVQAFDRFGGWLWTAEHPTAEAVDAYIEIVEVTPLILWNFACYRCTLDPGTGKLLKAQFIQPN